MNTITGLNFSSFPLLTPSSTSNNMEVDFPEDVYAFYTKIANANETFHRIRFLNLRSHEFSNEINSYSELETTVMFGYKELFREQYKPEFFNVAFSTALFFKQSEILKMLLEESTLEQQFFMLDCLIHFPEFDDIIEIYEMKMKSEVLSPEYQQYVTNFLKQVTSIRTFCTCRTTQAQVLEAALDEEKRFFLLWNRANSELRATQDSNGVTLLECAIFKCKLSIVQFLLNNGVNVKTFNGNRQTPLKFARLNFAGDPIVKEFEKRDEGFTQHVEKFEEFGHRIQLVSKVSFFAGIQKKDGHRLVDSIVKSIEAFSQTNKCSRFSPSKIQKFIESLGVAKETKAASLFDLAKKNWVVMQGGWTHHFVAYIYGVRLIQGLHNKTASFCVKINTSSSVFKGLRFYEIKNPSDMELQKAIRDSILDSLTLVPAHLGEAHFEALDKRLSLEKIAEIPFAQDEPNCTWMALKAAFLGLLIIDEASSQSNSLTSASVQKAHAAIRSSFDAWEEWDLIHSFTCLKNLMQLYPSLFDENMTFGRVIKKCLSRGLEKSIFNLVKLDASVRLWQDEIKKTLIRYAYTQNMAYLFVLLIKLKVDVNTCDKFGQTLAHDIAANSFLLMAILKNASAFQLTDSEIHTLSQYLPKQSG